MTASTHDMQPLQPLIRGVLTRLGAAAPTLEQAARDVAAVCAAFVDAPAIGSDGDPTGLAQHAQTTTSGQLLAQRTVDAARWAHLFTLVATTSYLSAQARTDGPAITLLYRQWRSLRALPGAHGVLWDDVFSWQQPAWAAHLRDSDTSEPATEPLQPTTPSRHSVQWLTARIVDEAALQQAPDASSLVNWLISPDDTSTSWTARRRASRCFERANQLAHHAIERLVTEKVPRASWGDRYPPAIWCAHAQRAMDAEPRSWVANVAANALNTYPYFGPAPLRGAARHRAAHPSPVVDW